MKWTTTQREKSKQLLYSLLLFLIYTYNLKQDFLMLCLRFDIMPDTKFDFTFNANEKVDIIVKSFNNTIAVSRGVVRRGQKGLKPPLKY